MNETIKQITKMKKNLKIATLYLTGFVLLAQGIFLGLYMYFSTFMPGNPWRKCFYGVAFIDLAIGCFIIWAACEAQQRLARRRRVARRRR